MFYYQKALLRLLVVSLSAIALAGVASSRPSSPVKASACVECFGCYVCRGAIGSGANSCYWPASCCVPQGQCL